MGTIVVLIFFLVFISSSHGATIYKWVDKDGVVNFTDDLSKVPFSYRNRVEVEERKDVKEKVTPPRPRAATPENDQEEIRKDIYGRDETWGREKVRPWRERLREATEKYETAQKRYTEKSDELSRGRLGSSDPI